MPPHPLTNFEIKRYFQNQWKFNGVYLRNKLPEIKDGTFAISLDEYKSVGVHWVSLYVNGENLTYFDGFGVENVPKKLKNSYEIKTNNSIMWGYIHIGLIDFIIKSKKFFDYTDLFSPNKYEYNGKIILNYFQ